MEKDLVDNGSSLKKVPVILTVVYTFITCGIYYPVWFLTRLKGLNALNSPVKLDKKIFILITVIFSLALLEGLVSGIVTGMSQAPIDSGCTLESLKCNPADMIAFIMSMVAYAGIIFESFKVKKILLDHYEVHLGRAVSFSTLMIFLFQNWYLQYKINRL